MIFRIFVKNYIKVRFHVKHDIKNEILFEDGDQKKVLCENGDENRSLSGADNFYDAGSCIDGRLTSAWNW